MKAELRIANRHYVTLRDTLFDRGGVEGAAFLMAKPTRVGGRHLLTVHDLWAPPLDPAVAHVRLPASALIEAVNRANDNGSILIEAHSHPGAGVASFSSVDEEGLSQVAPYMVGSLATGIYGATVWGDDGLEARIYDKGGAQDVAEVRVFDGRISSLRLAKTILPAARQDARFDRLERAIGRKARAATSRLKVGIVGLGGLGSHLVQALVAAGVKLFVLVDHDVVKKENLDRIPYVTSRHVAERAPKVIAAKEHILSRFADSNVQAIPMGVDTAQALDALKGIDVLFGAVDTYFGRLIMTNLASAYLIPYFDCGTGVNVESEAIRDMGGRVSLLWPGEHCLLCAGRINSRLLNYEIADEADQQFARNRGYVKGADLPDPMVANLNGTLAHLASVELLASVSGFKRPAEQLFYDALRGTVEEVTFAPSLECRICGSQLGLAGASGVVERFSKQKAKLLTKPRKVKVPDHRVG